MDALKTKVADSLKDLGVSIEEADVVGDSYATDITMSLLKDLLRFIKMSQGLRLVLCALLAALMLGSSPQKASR